MKDTKPPALCLFFMLFFMPGRAQHLKPGFEKEEYAELVYIATRSSESPEKAKLIPLPQCSTGLPSLLAGKTSIKPLKR